MNFRRLHRGAAAAGLLTTIAAVSVVAMACGSGGNTSTPTAGNSQATAQSGSTTTAGNIPTDIGKGDSANVTGAGSTLAGPVYQAWGIDYHNKVAKGVQLNYQLVGSGAGVQQFTAGTVDFGASDAPMSDQELAAAPDAQEVPTIIGAAVLTYNLSGLTAPLKLDGPTIANIYLGKIAKWNDPAISALNPGVSLPSGGIQVVYRSDSSGTSYAFTDYLSKVSPDWKSKVGTNKSPNWPVGQGGKGSAGVTGVVKNTPNAIGYVELNYAVTNKLPYADVKNQSGTFITPTVASSAAAADGVVIPADFRVSITDSTNSSAYPISTFTYLILYKSTGKCSRQTPLINFLWWGFHDPAPQKTVTDLSFSPLPAKILPSVDSVLKGLKCDGGSKSSLSSGG